MRCASETSRNSAAAEAPEPPDLGYLEAWLVVPIKQLARDAPGGVLVRQLDGV